MIEVWTKENCPFCDRAKALLRESNLPFTEKKLGVDFTREILLEKYPTATTYPVVVLDGFFIGGFTQLNEHLQRDKKQILLDEFSWNGN